MKRVWNKIMNRLEMRNFEQHYEPEETEMSGQERLIYNNNYNSNHNHLHNSSNNIIHTNSSGGSGSSSSSSHHSQLPPAAMSGVEGENHYQLPYAHLHPGQSPYLGSPQHPPLPPGLQYHPHQQQHGYYSS
ncbi:hypothetical protein EGW08_017886, partial [Elysia chlorotica]